MMPPDATIIIPQRNHAALTLQCLHSLSRLESQCWSAIVVDDGSDDGSVAMIRSANVAACRVMEQSRRGVTAAWNTGISQATTPFVVLLNNDVQIAGPFVDRLVHPLRNRQASIVGAEWRIEPLIQGRVLSGWCFAFALALWRDLGGFDEAMAWYFSDTDFQCRAARVGCELASVDRLPLRHLGHRTTRRDPQRRAVWLSDRTRFLAKWPQP
jgi:GT2 family glycosyltransferase